MRPIYEVRRVALGSVDARKILPAPDGGVPAELGARSFDHFAVLDAVWPNWVAELGGEQPSIDAFASPKNSQFPRYWTQKDSAWGKGLAYGGPIVG